MIEIAILKLADDGGYPSLLLNSKECDLPGRQASDQDAYRNQCRTSIRHDLPNDLSIVKT